MVAFLTSRILLSQCSRKYLCIGTVTTISIQDQFEGRVKLRHAESISNPILTNLTAVY